MEKQNKEKSLSDKVFEEIEFSDQGAGIDSFIYDQEDIREAVKKLKNACPRCYGSRNVKNAPQCNECFKIDEIFGEKLI